MGGGVGQCIWKERLFLSVKDSSYVTCEWPQAGRAEDLSQDFRAGATWRGARRLWYPYAVDIERTMQFILDSQARAEARMEKSEARMEKSDGRVAAMEKRLDRRMDAITKLLQQGMRMLAKTDTRLAELAQAQAELAQAQKQTDRSLKALINGLRQGRNGR